MGDYQPGPGTPGGTERSILPRASETGHHKAPPKETGNKEEIALPFVSIAGMRLLVPGVVRSPPRSMTGGSRRSRT